MTEPVIGVGPTGLPYFECEECGAYFERKVYRSSPHPRFCSRKCLGIASAKTWDTDGSLRAWNERLGEQLRRVTSGEGIFGTTNGGMADDDVITTYMQWEAEFHPERIKRGR